MILGPEEVAVKFTKALPDALSVKVSESLNLEAAVTGVPKPEIEWLRDDEKIENNEHTVLKREGDVLQLFIKESEQTDAGSYVIVAKNKLGSVRSGCHVSVDSAPVFEKELQEVKAIAGEDIRFDVIVKGHPKPELFWSLNGKSVDNQGRFEVVADKEITSLVIKNCEVEDTGEVKCSASNGAGEVTSVAHLEVAKPLAVPEIAKDVQLEIESEEGADVLLSLPFFGDDVKVRW